MRRATAVVLFTLALTGCGRKAAPTDGNGEPAGKNPPGPAAALPSGDSVPAKPGPDRAQASRHQLAIVTPATSSDRVAAPPGPARAVTPSAPAKLAGPGFSELSYPPSTLPVVPTVPTPDVTPVATPAPVTPMQPAAVQPKVAPPGGSSESAQPSKDDPKKAAPPKIDPKEPTKVKWPSEVAGRTLDAYLKDLSDPDPAIQVNALQAIPQFGPAAQKPAAKYLMRLMSPQQDPEVQLAAITCAGQLGFDDADVKDAALKLGQLVDNSFPASRTRLSAIQAIAAFGGKAEPAIRFLAGAPASDPSHAVRQATAEALAAAGFNEKTGPYKSALDCLTTKSITDRSVVVRLAGVRTMIVLGPPWAKPLPPAPANGPPPTPEIDVTAAALYFKPLKARLLPATKRVGEPPSATGVAEPNKQVEIWVRVAILRFDTKIDEKELDDTLNGITKYLTDEELGPKLQALNALAMLGEIGAKRIDDVVKTLNTDPDRNVVNAAITTLAAMGAEGRPAIPALTGAAKKYTSLRDEHYTKVLAENKIVPESLKEEERKMIVAQLPEEHTRLMAEKAIEAIKEAGKGPDAKSPKTP